MSNKGDIAYCNSQFKKQKHWSEISEEKFCLLLGSCGKLLRVLTLIYTDAEETVYYTEVKTPSFYKVNTIGSMVEWFDEEREGAHKYFIMEKVG